MHGLRSLDPVPIIANAAALEPRPTARLAPRSETPVRRVFVLVRVPKSGSTTLFWMMKSALPEASLYRMPKLMRSDEGPSRLEKWRESRGRVRRFWKLFRALSEEGAWRRLADRLNDGDIVSGHFAFGTPVLPGFRADYITLLRNPLDRLISEYHYARESFRRLGRIHRLYHGGAVRAAGHLCFGDYLSFLEEHRELFENIATRYVTGARSCDDPIGFLDRHYHHWGAVERLEMFAEGLSAKLGVPVQPRHERVTSNKPEITLSPSDRSRFERLFGEDLRMYEMALHRIDSGAGKQRSSSPL
jgi:hypothetical protein